MSLGRKIVEFTDEILAQPDHELTLRLTLLLLILWGTMRGWAQIPLQLICGLMLVSPSLHRNRWLWTLVVLLVAIPNAQDWFIIDNHKFLITYWALACLLSLFTREPGRLLEHNARLLLGLTFALAVLWKFLGGEFLNGDFLTFTMLSERRVAATAAPALGLAPADLAYNMRALAYLKLYPEPGAGFTLSAPAYVHTIGLVWSYATILVEGAVAAAFLLHRPQWVERNRHDVLLAFCLLTYWLLPVPGFAFVLLVMGLAQCPAEQKESRRWYLWTIVAIQFLAVPFGALASAVID
jgi:hypothetical protein